MRIKKHLSLSSGLETATENGSLSVVKDALRLVDLDRLEKKVSREKGREGRLLWSPIQINKAFEERMDAAGWQEYTDNYFVCEDFDVNRAAALLPYHEQKAFIRAARLKPYRSNTQSDFLRDGMVIEMQLGKYTFPFYDIMIKNSILRRMGLVQCAIEIVPMKDLQAQMSSGPAYFEHVSDKFSKMHPDDLPRLPTLILGIC
ncbi:BglII/BstYI family type II restriction endonuclease [Rhizobium sp. BK176]|uniref:BglII/BstYI family type II restriction endonuclease n=1 Tax=Rhizobium sp. BK176 TaxID=2587071 RepID=UPI002169E08A|nr:BglII/BstYI family type II restriction endonuclease [Rhizobium sp. BK176]MCS4089277.1 hypothetical protein [Rhizobium sp. BK176]